MKIEHPVYLGDGLYANFDGYQIKLYTQETEDAFGRVVFLDATVLAAFLKYVGVKDDN